MECTSSPSFSWLRKKTTNERMTSGISYLAAASPSSQEVAESSAGIASAAATSVGGLRAEVGQVVDHDLVFGVEAFHYY